MIRRPRRTIRQRVRTMEEGVGGGGAITGGELLRLMEDLRGNAQLALATRRYFSPQSTGQVKVTVDTVELNHVDMQLCLRVLALSEKRIDSVIEIKVRSRAPLKRTPARRGTEITDKRNFTIKILVLLLQRHA